MPKVTHCFHAKKGTPQAAEIDTALHFRCDHRSVICLLAETRPALRLKRNRRLYNQCRCSVIVARLLNRKVALLSMLIDD